MAFILTNPNTEFEEKKKLLKPVYTIGSDPNSDIQIYCKDNQESKRICALITKRRDNYEIKQSDSNAHIEISGKKISQHTLSDGDVIVVDNNKLLFKKLINNDAQQLSKLSLKKSTLGKDNRQEYNAYKKFLEFSDKLAKEKDIHSLLNTLLDEVISLTNAENGFLILLKDKTPEVRVARNLAHENITDTPIEKSWTIVKKVIQTKQPVILNDAKHDTEFNATKSVINFKLSSIMCVPLAYRGNVLGAIYVGNNTFSSVFDEKSLNTLLIFASQAALLVQNAIQVNALNNETKTLREKLEYTRYGEIIGACDTMQQVFRSIDKVARTDVTVLITGPTGTGKELITRELHRRSSRADGPFVVINCGAIPENLLESELFGHVRGAFTGAVSSQVGKFQSAHRGTLFLDEIGEMPLHLQVKILRVLQDSKVTRVGSTTSEEIDIRIIAATNRNLDNMVTQGTFRDDLFYRLNVIQLKIPPLNERGNDVLVISNYILQKYAALYGKKAISFNEASQNSLLNYHWPGNIRQLENRIKRAIVMCDSNKIKPQDLDLSSQNETKILPLSDASEIFRQRYINDALERNAHNRTKAAKELGVDPRTIFRHLQHCREEG